MRIGTAHCAFPLVFDNTRPTDADMRTDLALHVKRNSTVRDRPSVTVPVRDARVVEILDALAVESSSRASSRPLYPTPVAFRQERSYLLSEIDRRDHGLRQSA